MALDLYVNSERYSNSPIFYRITDPLVTSTPFTVSVVDLEATEPLGMEYDAEYSINGKPFQQMDIDNYGQISALVNFDTSFISICSIRVKVYKGQNNIVKDLTMQGIFLSSFPSVDFHLYPSQYLDTFQRRMIQLTPQSYFYDSPGPVFYGEGHTEIFELSCKSDINLDQDGNGVTWFVGNSGNSGFSYSLFPITTKTSYTASVAITSTVDDQRIHPVSVKITTSDITREGPNITYDDETGEPSFYPFFASTLDLSGNNLNQKHKGSIKALVYPTTNIPTVIPPFSSTHFSLPLDHSLQTFRSIIYNPRTPSFISEKFIGTSWELEAKSDVGEWSISTPLLTSILAYQFKLGYDTTENDLMLPTFYASSIVSTLMTISVSAFKDLWIDLPPYDWQHKRVHYDKQSQTVIGPIPFVKLYIPNYYYLRGQDVPITIVSAPSAPFELYSLSITSNHHSAETLTLSAAELSGIMHFDRTGPVDLNVTATLINPNNGIKQETTIIFDNMLEIVPVFDKVDEQYFLTSLTPLTLTYENQPRLSPNEWAIADNVNSIIEKLYTTIDDLDDYTKLYENATKLYAWFGPALRVPPNEFGITPFPVYLWADLECATEDTEEFATWATFECKKAAEHYTWGYHYCEGGQKKIDPTCFQKHCLNWDWKSRKQGFGHVNVSWKHTKFGNPLQKRWSYEKCEYDSELLNCNFDTWKVSTIDSLYYPIPMGNVTSRCGIIGAEYYPKTDHIVFAHSTEINLAENTYYGKVVARKGISDDAFAFQNIVGFGITSEGKVVVLDSVLCRISVFDVITDSPEFKLFNSWGTYGTAETPRGFNKPQDIHIDKYDSAWIADTGNKCVKKFSIVGKHVLTIRHETFEDHPPLSMCVDSSSNIHCLIDSGVLVFDQYGVFLFDYTFPEKIYNVKKINASYNKQMIYITHETGVVKYFRTGTIAYYLVDNVLCGDGAYLHKFVSVSQDKYRNLFITVGDKILKVPDLQKLVELKAALPADLYWKLEDLLIHKEEYIQPWVYLKAFHRLWDNIEIVRNALTYEPSGCKSYSSPKYKKEDLVIGQNELVTNAVINRLSEQLWANLSSLFNYFDPNCEK